MKPIQLAHSIEENKVTMSCQVHGIPTPTIKWLCRDEEIIANEATEFFYDENTGCASVILCEHMENVAAVYTVVVENEFGRAISQMENVHVHKTPVRRVQRRKLRKAPRVTPLNPQSICFNDTLILQSQYSGIPEPIVMWLKNGKQIELTENADEQLTIITENNVTRLQITDVDRKRAGKYEIVATNEVGEARASCSVMITKETDAADLIAPQFIETLKPKTAMNGDCVILEAKIESFPLSSFQWFFKSQPLVTNDTIRIYSADNRSILRIESVTHEMDGIYTCRAENVAGSVTSSASIRLVEAETELDEQQKEAAPRFAQKLQPLQLMDGDSLKLTCRVIGYPIPQIQWLRNKHVLAEDKGIHIIQDTHGVCELHIPEIFVEDAGIYVCKANNKCGKATTKTNVIIEGIQNCTELKIPLSTLVFVCYCYFCPCLPGCNS